VKPYMCDGNYVIASSHKQPWLKQFNMLIGLRLVLQPAPHVRLPAGQTFESRPQAAAIQVIGMWGLIQTIRRTAFWALRLGFGQIERMTESPRSPLPMRSVVAGETACHAPMNTAPQVSVKISVKIASSRRRTVALADRGGDMPHLRDAIHLPHESKDQPPRRQGAPPAP